MNLISIHIPKTAGTSFYRILQQVYGSKLSTSYKRKDIVGRNPAFENHEVIHGHFYYQEIAHLHKKYNPKIICWLRHPLDRVISNYHFFMDGLRNPARNPKQFELNKHRINEDLRTFASRQETQNVMSKFLEGIALEELFFVGQMENFEQEIQRLALKLDWPDIDLVSLNVGTYPQNTDMYEELKAQISAWNEKDLRLYRCAFSE